MMLQCYVDESGNNQGLVMVMLGVISDPPSWAKFSDEWQECLDMRPPMKSLHMTDLMCRESDEAMERAARFYRILCDRVKGIVIVSMPLTEYRQVFAQAHPLFKNPYFFMFFQLIRNCRHHCQAIGLNDRVQFTFDEQSGVLGKLVEGWEFYGQNYPETAAFLGEFPAFKNDEEVLPLQASDFVAWIVRRVLSDEIEGKPKISLPWSFRDEIPHVWARYDRAMLQADYTLMTGA